MSYAIAVDIGGTFTDLVAFDHESRRVIYAKSPTTYENLVDGILECFHKAKIRPADASLVNPERPEHADIVEAEIPVVVVALRERHAFGRKDIAKRLKVQRLAVGDDAVEVENYRAKHRFLL